MEDIDSATLSDEQALHRRTPPPGASLEFAP
jgi:hypothetical protein